MKIQILSDIHTEFKPFDYQPTDAEIVVLAGDIGEKTKGIKWARENITDKPVIYVLGNHEYYGDAYPKLIEDLKVIAKGTNVHLLENDIFKYEDINFIGCSLWTDFKLNGDQRAAIYDCQRGMTDYRMIRKSPQFSLLRPADTIAIHSASVDWLNRTLEAHKGEQNVVITHHAPSSLSESETYKGGMLSPAFASNLDHLVEKANLWIHGHMHESVDYRLGECRVLCNPRGYVPYEINPNFNPQLVVEL